MVESKTSLKQWRKKNYTCEKKEKVSAVLRVRIYIYHYYSLNNIHLETTAEHTFAQRRHHQMPKSAKCDNEVMIKEKACRSD